MSKKSKKAGKAIRKAEKSKIKAARKAKYAAFAASGDNSKRKQRDSKRAVKLNINRPGTRKPPERSVEIRVYSGSGTTITYLTRKQAKNTVSLKQFLKTL